MSHNVIVCTSGGEEVKLRTFLAYHRSGEPLFAWCEEIVYVFLEKSFQFRLLGMACLFWLGISFVNSSLSNTLV